MNKSIGSENQSQNYPVEGKHLKTTPPGNSLRKGAGQGAPAPPTLRCGPAGDFAPPLRLRRPVGPKGSLPARQVRPEPPLSLVNDAAPRIGPERSRARERQSGPLTARTDLESSKGEGKGGSCPLAQPPFHRSCVPSFSAPPGGAFRAFPQG